MNSSKNSSFAKAPADAKAWADKPGGRSKTGLDADEAYDL